MDQIKKHQFWIITGLAVVLGIVSYVMTSSTLNKLYSDQATALDAKFTDVSSTKGKISTHPNDFSKAKMQLIIDDLARDVQAAWQAQYERQIPLLQWPEGALHNKKLIEKLKAYTPIETSLTYPEEPKQIVAGDKRAYALYFQDQMKEIVKIIGCEWVGKASENAQGGMGMDGYGSMGAGGGMPDMGSGDGMYAGGTGMPGMMSNMPLLPKDLVIWPKASQDELITSIRLWQGDTPSVYEILYTQENMWILQGLMHIIATTNQGAIENFQTAVKEIEFIRIGKPAVGKAGVIDPPKKAGGAGYGSMDGSAMGEGMMEDSGMSGGDMMYGSETGGDSGSAEDGTGMVMVVPDPANGRYVDATFAPLTGDDVRSKSQSESPEDAYFAVAKRVPVRLRFKMDQRKLPILLANCGNADLMLEIRQVRIGDTTAAVAGGAGGYGGGGMGSMMMGGGSDMGGYGSGADGYGSGADMYGGGDMGSGMMGSGMMGSGMMGGMLGGPAAKPTWEMPVEIYGVVYLYNPVSIKRLGLDKVTGETEVADTVENPDTSSEVPQNPGANAPAPDGTPADAGTSGAPNNGVPNNGVPNNGVPNNGVPNNGVPNNGVPGNGTPPAAAPPVAPVPAAPASAPAVTQ